MSAGSLLVWLASTAVSPRTAVMVPDSVPVACRNSGIETGFRWRSGFWLNLYSFLHHQAKERLGIHNDAPPAMAVVYDESAGVRSLTTSERAAWQGMLGRFASTVWATGLKDSMIQQVNNRLAAAADGDTLGDVAVDSGLRRFLLEAAPLYRAIWWPVHDRRNREWIASVRALLDPHAACLARLLAADLAAPWPPAPIDIDVSVYATWFGAYSTLHPLHVTLSSNARGNQGMLGVETVLHETGHALLGVVDSALAATALREHRALPPELSHLVLFFTAGQDVAALYPAHQPYAQVFRLWEQNTTARGYRATLNREWEPYLEGRRTLGEAITAIVRTLPRNAS
jgi:hypothetical protein